MAPLSLKIVKDKGAVTRKVKLDSELKVCEAHKIIKEKFLDNIVGNSDYGLFLRSLDDDHSGVWMEDQRTLGYYVLRDGDVIEYLSKITNLKVRMLDDTVKTLKVDQTKPVSDLMTIICGKIGITNSEEYGLCVDNEDDTEDVKDRSGTTGTLTLKKKSHLKEKEKDVWMEQFSKKLKTDDNVEWVDPHKTLAEDGVDPNRTLLLKRRLFYSDCKVDERDPVQLNLLYVQARDSILNSQHPVTEEQAAECKVRWVNIRDAHRRTYKKSLEGGIMAPKRPYKYDKQLEFMRIYYKDIYRSNNTEVTEDSDNEADKIENWDEVVLEYNESEEDKPLKKRKKQKKTKAKFEEVDVSTSVVNEPSTSEFNTSEQVDAFLLSIGATLKKFTPYHLNLAKSKIFHIVQEHDLQQIVEKQSGKAETSDAMYFQG